MIYVLLLDYTTKKAVDFVFWRKIRSLGTKMCRWSISIIFWLLSIISDTFDYFWLLSIISDYFRLFPITFEYFRLLSIISDYFRLLSIIFDYFRLFPITFDYFQLLSIISDYFRFFLITFIYFRNSWRSLTWAPLEFPKMALPAIHLWTPIIFFFCLTWFGTFWCVVFIKAYQICGLASKAFEIGSFLSE